MNYIINNCYILMNSSDMKYQNIDFIGILNIHCCLINKNSYRTNNYLDYKYYSLKILKCMGYKNLYSKSNYFDMKDIMLYCKLNNWSIGFHMIDILLLGQYNHLNMNYIDQSHIKHNLKILKCINCIQNLKKSNYHYISYMQFDHITCNQDINYYIFSNYHYSLCSPQCNLYIESNRNLYIPLHIGSHS